MNFAIVPVKQLSRAKERLASLLSPAERSSLAFAMLEDVLSVLFRSKKLDGVTVISNDPTVWELAKSLGAWVIRETSQEGESASVERATKACMAWGASTVLIVPSDIPLIAPSDVELVIEKAEVLSGHRLRGQGARPVIEKNGDEPEAEPDAPCVILVPSLDGTGTNALLRRPPEAIPSHFGANSFQAHIAEVERQKIPYEACELPRIALDIDSPEDLKLFLSTESQTRSYRELLKMGIPSRMR